MTSVLQRAHELYALLDRLNYYQILGVEPGSSLAQLRQAYFALAAAYHPDRFLTLQDETLRNEIASVFKRMTEAYRVVTDKERRQSYDQGLKSDPHGAHLRYHTVERPRVGPRDPTEIAETPAGRKYVGHALQAERQGNLSTAAMHLGLALQVEPHNKDIAQKLADLKARAGAKK